MYRERHRYRQAGRALSRHFECSFEDSSRTERRIWPFELNCIGTQRSSGAFYIEFKKQGYLG